MAMSTSSGGDEGDVPQCEINVTPLADVMLVLLIIFMITAPLMSHKVKIDLPHANPHTKKEVAANAQPIDLAVEPDGTLYWNGSQVSDFIYGARLRAAAALKPQPPMKIRAAKDTKYKVIWKVMQDAKSAGLVHVGFVTTGKTGGVP
jgi:biopolymer transport protein ExbD